MTPPPKQNPFLKKKGVLLYSQIPRYLKLKPLPFNVIEAGSNYKVKENSCETLKVKDVDKSASSSSSKNSSDKDKCGDQRNKNKPDEASKGVFTGK